MIEIKAPSGYNLNLDSEVEFEIGSTQMDYEFTVTNKPKTLLLEAGGRGIFIISSMMVVVIILWKNKDRPIFVIRKKRSSRIGKSIRKK